MGTKQPANCGTPKKNMALYLGPVPAAAPWGVMEAPEKPPQYASQGTTVARHGTWAASQVVLTGIVVSGAELVKMRSAPPLIKPWVTWTATFGSDWVSTSVISIL